MSKGVDPSVIQPQEASLRISHPEYLEIVDERSSLHTGGSQEWYPTQWQRVSGCGPTNGTNLIVYLGRAFGLPALTPADHSKTAFLGRMEELWEFITPGKMGVNRLDIFSRGGIEYGASRGVKLNALTLEVPASPSQRPSGDRLLRFMEQALGGGLPVAFLNLSKGKVQLLDSWHWVTVISYDPRNRMAGIADQGKVIQVDLGLWMKTTRLGGGFVCFSPN